MRDLGWMGAIGVVGPVVLGAVLDWQAGELRAVAGVVALLSAGLACGTVSALCWNGRAPRVLLLPALAVVVSLSWAPVVAAVARGHLLQSLAILAAAGLLWAWLSSPGALAAHGRPWPKFEPLSWWRRRWAHRLWRSVPYRFGPNEYKRYGGSFWVVWLLIAQSHTYAGRVEWLSWGQSYTHFHAVLGYAAWLLVLGLLAASALIAPPVHWRQRLAPGGLSALRWARRLVLGSMLACVATLSVALMLAALVNKHPFWPLDASAWASALGDLLLVFSVATWWRGQRNRNTDILWFVAALAVAVPTVLGLWLASGLTPERGPVWLLIQLVLTIPITRAAIRAWAQQDMNLTA